MPFYIEFGPKNARIRLTPSRVADVWPIFQKLKTDNKIDVTIVSPDLEQVEPYFFKRAVESVNFR